MVKLDVTLLRYLTKEDFRILTAVEMGMKNHELVPASLIGSISALKHGGVGKILNDLCRHKLLCYESGKRYDGYRLTYLGYDYLALNVFRNRNVVSLVGNQIGVGKESDVYVAADDESKRYALKIHRLGRTCFRTVNDKRDYQKNGKKVHNWIYMSRLAALREFAFMKALHEKSFPVPTPVDCNRHCVVMELIEGTILNTVILDTLEEKEKLYNQLMNLLLSLANDYGVVHGDFNEFNIMIRDETNEPVLIDFPQMVPINHRFAEPYFERDVKCLVDLFKKRFNYEATDTPTWKDDVTVEAEKTLVPGLVEADDTFEDNPSGSEHGDVTAVDIDDLHIASADTLQTTIDSNSDEDQSVLSRYSTTTSMCTFAPAEIKSKIRREKQNVAKRKEIQQASRNVKGDSNAVRRKRKDNDLTIKEDLKTHAVDPF
ncbi:Serine/threonine-protein kinase RIO2 [Halotydeus destructor]|nr:Serine/threonine-protein kinase RIO2 [Halotydeus destructor]